MAKDDAVRGYAQALLSIAEAEGVLDRVEDELYAFAKSVERHADLREALTDEALPSERKKAVIDELLGERAQPLTATLVGFLVDAGQARHIGQIAEELAREQPTGPSGPSPRSGSPCRSRMRSGRSWRRR